MEILKGDLWDWHAKGWKIVISTNIGWTETPERWRELGGRGGAVGLAPLNNMGAGVSYQAAQQWPWLPEWLGSHYRAVHRAGGKQLPVELPDLNLIFVAVKPLLESDPAYSWNQRASLELIRQQLDALTQHKGDIALSFIGCGQNGGGLLEPAAVLPLLLKLEMMRSHAGYGRTLVVDREAE